MKNINPMKEIYSYKDFTITDPIEFKDVDGRKGIVTGYFANFDSLDADGDIITKGAFTKTIAATGPGSAKPRIKHLLNHDPSQPLGVITVLKEDNKGLYYESKLGTHGLGMDFVKMVESNLITEHSIGYQVRTFKQVTPWDEYREGDVKRELTELKLWEGSSLKEWGSNANTPLTGMKSVEINKLLNKAEAIEKFCRDSKATDETIETLLIYNKQLLQTITELTSIKSDVSIEPDTVEVDEKVEEIKRDEKAIEFFSKTIECPKCKRHTYDTFKEKGYVKCHRPECEAVFVGKLFVTI
jgi:HK97 family phage prohead protease